MTDIVAIDARDRIMPTIPSDAPHRRICEVIDVTTLPSGGHSEIALAWNSDTGEGRVLGHDIGRNYLEHGWDPGVEFAGTADRLGILEEDEQRIVFILDWKSGFRAGSAADSWQLKLLALAAVSAFDADGARVGHAYLREDEDEPRYELTEYDAVDLALFGEELRELRAALKYVAAEVDGGKVPDVTEGDHCQFCPAFDHCPAKNRLALSMLGRLQPDQLKVSELVDEDAGRAVFLVRDVNRIAERILDALKDRARQAPFLLPNGKLYTEVDGNEVFSEVITAQVLRGRYNDEVARAALDVKTGKSLIDEAVREYARANGLKMTKEVEAAFEAIRIAGGSTRGKKRIGEVKP